MSVLKSAEARLLQEREILHRQKSSSALVMENLNQIKLNLERGEAEKTMRLENRNDTLEKETALLRKKLETEQDSYKQAVAAWEASEKELREKLEEARVREVASKEEAEAINAKVEEVKRELAETQEKLEMAENQLNSRGMARQDSSQQSEVWFQSPLTKQSCNDICLKMMLCSVSHQKENNVLMLKELLVG